MQIITLYKYEREPGKYTVSPQQPTTETYETEYRLVAEKGKVLTKTGHGVVTCIDVVSPDGWSEIDAPKASVASAEAQEDDAE